MARRLICDTNVFYDHAEKKIDVRTLLQPGDTLWIAPLTAFELCALLDAGRFAKRQAAARAVVELGPRWLPNTDQLVCRLVGTSEPPDLMHYRDAVTALATAADFNQAITGVPDHGAQVVRTINPLAAKVWLDALKNRWMGDHDSALEKHIPGYDKYLAIPKASRPAVPKIAPADKAKLAALLSSPEWHKAVLGALVLKAWLVQSMAGTTMLDPATHTPPPSAPAAFHVFAAVFGRYQYEQRASGMRPQPNDSQDVEYLLYVNGPDDVFVTREERWLRLADDAGVGSSFLKP